MFLQDDYSWSKSGSHSPFIIWFPSSLWVDVFIQLCWLLGALLWKGFNGVSPSRYVEDGLCWTYIWTKQQGLQSSHPLLVSEDTHRVLECNAVWLVTLEKYCRRTNSHLSWKLNQSLQADEILLKRCNMSCWLWRILLCLHCQHLFWQHYNACFHWLSISKQKALLNPHLLQYLQEWWSVYLLLLGVFFDIPEHTLQTRNWSSFP